MKPLYLILICVSCSWGQGGWILHNKSPEHCKVCRQRIQDSVNQAEKRNRPEVKIKADKFIASRIENQPITIQDLLDYEKECYADSLVWIVETPRGKEIRRYVFPSKSKEPTFQGFIEYLKKRRK